MLSRGLAGLGVDELAMTVARGALDAHHEGVLVEVLARALAPREAHGDASDVTPALLAHAKTCERCLEALRAWAAVPFVIVDASADISRRCCVVGAALAS